MPPVPTALPGDGVVGLAAHGDRDTLQTCLGARAPQCWSALSRAPPRSGPERSLWLSSRFGESGFWRLGDGRAWARGPLLFSLCSWCAPSPQHAGPPSRASSVSWASPQHSGQCTASTADRVACPGLHPPCALDTQTQAHPGSIRGVERSPGKGPAGGGSSLLPPPAPRKCSPRWARNHTALPPCPLRCASLQQEGLPRQGAAGSSFTRWAWSRVEAGVWSPGRGTDGGHFLRLRLFTPGKTWLPVSKGSGFQGLIKEGSKGRTSRALTRP